MNLTKARLIMALATSAAAGAAAPTVISLRGEGVTYQVRLTSTPDSACILRGNALADTMALLHTASGRKRQTGLSKQAEAKLNDLFIAQCNDVDFVVDTIRDDSLPPVPSDTTTPDTTTPPPVDTQPPPPPIDTVPPPPVDTGPPPPVAEDTTALRILDQYIGPTLTLTRAIAAGRGLVDSTFFKWEPTVWAREGSQWAINYYDRCLIYYAWFGRTGNPLYRVRGDAICLDYRRNYLHVNNYQASSHWSQLDGVALHYWLTGDDSSRIAVGKTAWNLAPTITWARTGNYTDARTHARALTGVLLAWQMNAPNAPAAGWATTLDRGLDAILPQQSPDGAWRYPVNTCDLSLNYMGAMLADALIRVYETYRRDPRIPAAVSRTADFLWTQWRPGDAVPSFNYYEKVCSNQHGTGGPTATPDLTGLYTTTFAWMARQDPVYQSKADAVLLNTMRGVYPYAKQFNQAFTYPWRALGYLP